MLFRHPVEKSNITLNSILLQEPVFTLQKLQDLHFFLGILQFYKDIPWYKFLFIYLSVAFQPEDLCFFFSFSFFFLPHAGSQFPNQGSNPCPLQWKFRVLTTGPPGNSQDLCLFNSKFFLTLVVCFPSFLNSYLANIGLPQFILHSPTFFFLIFSTASPFWFTLWDFFHFLFQASVENFIQIIVFCFLSFFNQSSILYTSVYTCQSQLPNSAQSTCPLDPCPYHLRTISSVSPLYQTMSLLSLFLVLSVVPACSGAY